MSKPSWISLDPTSGTGDGSSQVTASPYTGRSSRQGIITGSTSTAQDTVQVTQSGKEEFITADESSLNVSNLGGNVVISGTSNSADIKVTYGSSRIEGVLYTIEVNEVEDDSWDGNADTGIDGDPGASSEFSFRITAAFPENESDSDRTCVIVLKNKSESVESEEITVLQSARTVTYSVPEILSFTYDSDVPAGGGSVTPQVTYRQTFGFNGQTSGGGTITSGGELTFTGSGVDPATGKVTGPDLGITVKERTLLATAGVTVTLNGKTSVSSSASAYQEANSETVGEVLISGGAVADIPASGGSVSSATGMTVSQTISYTSGAEKDASVDVSYSQAVSGSNLGTAVTTRTKKGTLTATASGEGGKSAQKQFDVYQAANSAEYGEITIAQTTPVSLEAAGQTYALQPASQEVTYTSGASETSMDLSLECTVKTPVDGFSLNGTQVTVTENPGTSQRGGFVVTMTATGGDGVTKATKDITFNQLGSESMIQVTPEELVFEASGGTKTITITSNDSWTIS